VSYTREFAAILVRAAHGLTASIQRQGGCPQDVLARTGLTAEFLDNPDASLALSSYTALLETASCEVGSDTFGLQYAKDFDIACLGALGRLFSLESNVGAALDKFVRFFPSLQGGTEIALGVSDGVARLSYLIADPAVRLRAQDAYFSIATFCEALRRIMGRKWRPTYIDFEPDAPQSLGEFTTYFDCPVRFGRRQNAVFFPAHFLDAPIPSADPLRSSRLEHDLREALTSAQALLDFVQGVEGWITHAICQATPVDIEHAGRDLGMSARTLQRKLDARGVSFLDRKNEVRMRLARCMLAQTELAITSIALHLGYSESSAFTRAFRAHSGTTPAAFRANGQHADALPAVPATPFQVPPLSGRRLGATHV
jgi:AraC-like DNA-binding protein